MDHSSLKRQKVNKKCSNSKDNLRTQTIIAVQLSANRLSHDSSSTLTLDPHPRWTETESQSGGVVLPKFPSLKRILYAIGSCFLSQYVLNISY